MQSQLRFKVITLVYESIIHLFPSRKLIKNEKFHTGIQTLNSRRSFFFRHAHAHTWACERQARRPRAYSQYVIACYYIVTCRLLITSFQGSCIDNVNRA